MQLLFDHFDRLADAPNGVAKLRELILQLAVQGKLVPQNPDDEPASELLKRIKAEKEKLIGEGKIKKDKPLPPITDDEIPYELPKGWVWCRLGEISTKVQDGTHFSPKMQYNQKRKGQYLYLTSKNVRDGGVSLVGATYIDAQTHQTIHQRCNPEFGDILLVKDGAKTGRVCLNDLKEEFSLLSSVALIKPSVDNISPMYIVYYLKSPLGQEKVVGRMSGSAITRIILEKVKLTTITLPPISEQKRIVTKVDQLMQLCDELEQQQRERQKKRISLNNAALNKLTTENQPEAFQKNWQFIAGNFNLLYQDPDNVSKLKQAILQLAVQGKLVPQDPNDEPASELLQRIQAEKEKLIAKGKIKKQKPLPPIADDEIPYELPKGWVWCRLGEITSKIGSGSTPRGGKSVYVSEGINFLRSQNVWNEGLRLGDVAKISFNVHEKMKGTHVDPKDVLLNITGASIGRSAIVPDDFDSGNVSQHVSIIRFVDNSIVSFMHKLIISPFFQKTVMDVQVGISREGLSKTSLEKFMVPLPSFEDQKRIVAKVDQLIQLCNELEQTLQQSQQEADQLLQAVLHDIWSAGALLPQPQNQSSMEKSR